MAVLAVYPIVQVFDDNGDPLTSGKVYTYVSGTSTNKTTYTDATGLTANANPVILSSRGEASIWLDTDAAYRFVIKDSNDVTIRTVDGIIGMQSVTSGGVTVGGDLNIGNYSIVDASTNEYVKFTATASAVNELAVTNAITGASPALSVSGGDTNIGIIVKGKGTGPVRLGQATSTDVRLEADQPIADSSGNELVKFVKTASAVNEITITNNVTGSNPVLSATGGDTNIGVNVTPKGSGVLDLTIGAFNQNKGSDIASATTTDIGAATGNYLDVTGTTTITGLGTVKAGTQRIVRFSDALTLTHNATSLILPSSANIVTVAGDTAHFVSLGSGNWKCTCYIRQDGTVLVSDTSQFVTLATSSTLANERVLTAGTGITLTDGGAGSTITAAVKWTGITNQTVIKKASTETVTSSTTLQNDDELTFAVSANKKYFAEMIVLAFGAAAGDIKFDLSLPAAASANCTYFGPILATTDVTSTSVSFRSVGNGTEVGIGCDGANQQLIVAYFDITIGANAGSALVQWAQNTSNATGTEVRAGSYLLVHQLD